MGKKRDWILNKKRVRQEVILPEEIKNGALRVCGKYDISMSIYVGALLKCVQQNQLILDIDMFKRYCEEFDFHHKKKIDLPAVNHGQELINDATIEAFSQFMGRVQL